MTGRSAGHSGFETAMMEAVDARDWDAVRAAVEQGADAAAGGSVALKKAVEFEQVELAKYLIEQGADVHLEDDYPLKTAMLVGNVELGAMLIEHGADMTAGRLSMLAHAATLCHGEFMTLLLDNGFDASTEDLGKMMVAGAMDGALSVVRAVAEHAGDALHTEYRQAAHDALHRAAEGLSEDIVAYLIDKGVDPTGDDGAPLEIAARNGFVGIAQKLVAAGADIAAGNHAAIRAAAGTGNMEMIGFLEQTGADLNGNAEAPLRAAACNDHLPVLRHLVEKHNAHVGASDNEALYQALCNNRPDAVTFLLEHGGTLRMEQRRDASFEARATGMSINEAMDAYETYTATRRKEAAFNRERDRFSAARRKLKNRKGPKLGR